MANQISEQWKDQTSFVTDSDFQLLSEWENQRAHLLLVDQKKELQKIIDEEINVSNNNQKFLPLQPLGPNNPGMRLSYEELKEFGSNHKKMEILLIKRDILAKLIHKKK